MVTVVYSFRAGAGLVCALGLNSRRSELREIAQALFDGAPRFRIASPGPTTPLEASAMPIHGGGATECVAELRFFPAGQASHVNPVASFIIRFARSTSEAEAEREIACQVTMRDSSFISSKAVCLDEVKAVAPNAVAYVHAEQQAHTPTPPLQDVLADIVVDSSRMTLLEEQLQGILKAVRFPSTTRYTKEARQWLTGLRHRLLPDYIIDLRGHRSKTVAGVFVVLRGDDSLPDENLLAGLPEAELSELQFAGREWLGKELAVLVCPETQGRGYYTMQDHTTGAVVWLFPPSGAVFPSGPTECPRLVVHSEDLREACCSLAGLGLPSSLSTLRMCEDAGETTVGFEFQHADLHTGNIVVGKHIALAVDMPGFGQDIEYAAASRLEASLIGGKALDALPEHVADAARKRISSAIWTATQCELGAQGVRLSRRIQSILWLRRLVAEALTELRPAQVPADLLLKHQGIRRLLTHLELLDTRTETAPTDTHTPADAVTLRSLWIPALTDPDLGGLREMGKTILSQLEASGYPLDAELTHLEKRLLAIDKKESVFLSERHVIIAGPTSSGKSTIGDLFLVRPALFNTWRKAALYIAPTRALAQARFREITERFPSVRAIVSTGDDHLDDWRLSQGLFEVACMTFEKSNVLFARSKRLLDRLACIVVDEIHMVADQTRGPIVELLLAKALRAPRIGGEGLRVVALTTEQSGHGGLVKWLSRGDAAGERATPHVVDSMERPVVADHYLAIPVKRDTSRPGVDLEMVPVWSEGAERAGCLSKDELRRIDRELDRLKTRRAAEKQETESRVIRFTARVLGDHPRGHLILVFMSSIERLQDIAHQIADSLDVVAPGEAYVERLYSALERSGSSPSDEYVELATKGVLIHHSMLDPALRAFAEEEAAHCTGEARSLVLLSTTTLMYGVNLSVDDVVVLGTRFTKSDRQRGEVDLQVALEPSEYFNMVGRAGRLGMGTPGARVFVVPREHDDPFKTIVTEYYCSTPELRSQLFHSYDRLAMRGGTGSSDSGFGALTNLLRRSERARPKGTVKASDLTNPFARCVLDALRHASAQDRLSPEEGSTLESVLRVMESTLYANQTDADEVNGLFIQAVEAVLQDCASGGALALVAADLTEPPAKYRIKPLGEALIDTGTEIASVAPVRGMLDALREAWSTINSTRAMPTELYLLALLPQNEVLRLVRDRLPELSDRPGWTPVAVEANKKAVLAAAARGLVGLGVTSELAEASLGAIRTSMEKTELRKYRSGYPGASADACLKLFAGICTWLQGETHDEALAVVNSSVATAVASGRLASLERLVEQLPYKLTFLATMLAVSRLGGAELERSLRSLGERVRYGCDEQAVLMFTAARKKPRRDAVLALRGAGMTPSQLIVNAGSVQGELRSLALQLSEDLRLRAVSELESLADDFAMTSDAPRGSGETIAWAFWRQLRGDYRSWAERGMSSNAASRAIRECLTSGGATSSVLSSSKDDAYRVIVGADGAEPRPSFILYGERREFVPPLDKRDRKAVDDEGSEAWKAHVAVHFDVLDPAAVDLRSPLLDSDYRHIVVVAVPWTIVTGQVLSGDVGAKLAARCARGQSTAFMTPAALAVMLSVVTRHFVPAMPVMELLAANSATASYTIGTAELMDLVDTHAVADFPGALREALAVFFEPRG